MENNHSDADPGNGEARRRPDRPTRLLLWGAVLLLCFSLPLYQWVRFGLGNDLYSYTLLVPLVSAYLFGSGPTAESVHPRPAFRLFGYLSAGLGVLAACAWLYAGVTGAGLTVQDAAALSMFAFVLSFAGLCGLTLPPAMQSRAKFPLGFLIFMVPFPVALEHGIESLLQHGSAPPAYWLFELVGTPLLREGLVFNLPGISIQIAPECSGIRSTLVLFMTSILAGHLFLRTAWRRVALTAFVIPLALARNGFRVFTIGQLCVSVGPHMIDSPIHHRGGPIFFALSLIPFFIFVFLLVRADRRASAASPTAS